MKVHEAEAILKSYADIPQRIEIIRRQCTALSLSLIHISASGAPVEADVTVAADPDVFPFGTVLYRCV